MRNRFTILLDKYKANKIIQQDGFGPFRAAGIISFVNHRCTNCHSIIGIGSLGNALEITEQGIIFLCMECRGINNPLTSDEIKDYKEQHYHYVLPEKYGFRRCRINQYKIITFLHSIYYKGYLSDVFMPIPLKPCLPIDIVMYIRWGVFGEHQRGDYFSNLGDPHNYYRLYDSLKIHRNCPECGSTFNFPYNRDIEKQMEESGLCGFCKIPTSAYWNMRNTLESDVEKLLKLTKFDNPDEREVKQKYLKKLIRYPKDSSRIF